MVQWPAVTRRSLCSNWKVTFEGWLPAGALPARPVWAKMHPAHQTAAHPSCQCHECHTCVAVSSYAYITRKVLQHNGALAVISVLLVVWRPLSTLAAAKCIQPRKTCMVWYFVKYSNCTDQPKPKWQRQHAQQSYFNPLACKTVLFQPPSSAPKNPHPRKCAAPPL